MRLLQKPSIDHLAMTKTAFVDKRREKAIALDNNDGANGVFKTKMLYHSSDNNAQWVIADIGFHTSRVCRFCQRLLQLCYCNSDCRKPIIV